MRLMRLSPMQLGHPTAASQVEVTEVNFKSEVLDTVAL